MDGDRHLAAGGALRLRRRERRLREAWGVASLEAFGTFSRAETAAAGALIDYLEITQKGRKARLSPPRRQSDGATMAIDAATRRNLELMRALDGGRRGSLLDAVDRTRTAGGGRLLARAAGGPVDRPGGHRRAARHGGLLRRPRRGPRRRARRPRGLPRHRTRAGAPVPRPRRPARPRRVARRPRTRRGAAPPPRRSGRDRPCAAARRPRRRRAAPRRPRRACDRLARALAPDPPPHPRDGGFIAEGYAAALDEQRELRDESRRLIGALQAEYAARAGVASLKIKHNNVLGYFVEVAAGHGDKLMADAALFIHRQTMAGAVRFSTSRWPNSPTGSPAPATARWRSSSNCSTTSWARSPARADDIAAAASALAEIDVAAAGAALAVERGYCRPEVDDGADFHVEGGRHPVVEAVRAGDGEFVANDCALAPGARLWLLTAPTWPARAPSCGRTR